MIATGTPEAAALGALAGGTVGLTHGCSVPLPDSKRAASLGQVCELSLVMPFSPAHGMIAGMEPQIHLELTRELDNHPGIHHQSVC